VALNGDRRRCRKNTTRRRGYFTHGYQHTVANSIGRRSQVVGMCGRQNLMNSLVSSRPSYSRVASRREIALPLPLCLHMGSCSEKNRWPVSVQGAKAGTGSGRGIYLTTNLLCIVGDDRLTLRIRSGFQSGLSYLSY